MSFTGLKPAMLYKDEIRKGLAERIYDDEMLYYSGWRGYYLPEIQDKFEGCDYQWAIIVEDELVGYLAYSYDCVAKSMSCFGLYSFKRGNVMFGTLVVRHVMECVKKYKIHRLEFRAIGGNPVIRHYDRFVNRLGGRKVILRDAICDNRSCYHDEIIYEVIFDDTV